MEQILFGLHDFLKTHVGITEEIALKELARRFTDTRISEHPEKKLEQVIADLIEGVAPHAVNVASPYFVGHMTSAIPYFMVHLKTIVAALNQNVVKIETSKSVSVVEKQVLAKIHRLVFQKDEAFYRSHVQDAETALGCFVEDGTLANVTALWVARNRLLKPNRHFPGVEDGGTAAGLKAHGIDRCVVLTTRFGHFSLQKAAGLLGIGNQNLLAVDTDARGRMDPQALDRTIARFHESGNRIRVMAVVGIAGTTETGVVDPLDRMADICEAHGIHFHVDAAWGGPTLMSETYRRILAGIERADSVTIDGHKQFYMPMTCGMVFFKDPRALDAVAYHSRYVNRPGSVDLGIRSISGSREANSLILDSALKIMGSKGYALLIEHGIETARAFAREIRKRSLFQLVTPPVLNILTYRLCPPALRTELESPDERRARRAAKTLDEINIALQRLQRQAGKSFVSRTTLTPADASGKEQVVLRSVIMNPMTTLDILKAVLDEQDALYRRHLA
jgi:glutamate decarboxylase